MGNWQVSGRVKTGFAALAGAVVVSLVGPGVAEAAAASEDSSSPNDPSSGAEAGAHAKQKDVPGAPGSAESPEPQQSDPKHAAPEQPAPQQPAPGAGHAPAPQSQPQPQDIPPGQSAHEQRPSADQSTPAPPSARTPAPHGRHARVEASGAPPATEASRSSAGEAALERAEVPQASTPPLDDLTKLVYTFLPTRTVLDPARTEADARALRDTLVRYWLGQLEQIRQQATDPDAAAEEFVANEWRRFRADPARYVGELRDRMAITAAAEASAEADTATDTATDAATDAATVTVGDRVAARAQRADHAQQVIQATEADGRVWGTEITVATDARSDIFGRLPNAQLAFTDVKNAVSAVNGAHAASDGPIASAATPANGW